MKSEIKSTVDCTIGYIRVESDDDLNCACLRIWDNTNDVWHEFLIQSIDDLGKIEMAIYELKKMMYDMQMGTS